MIPHQKTLILLFQLLLFICSTSAHYVNKSHSMPWRVRFYPKKTLFMKSDLIDKGCDVFIKECPQTYKETFICARHYDGQHRTFNNFCEMEYENCNSWRKWSMIKRTRC